MIHKEYIDKLTKQFLLQGMMIDKAHRCLLISVNNTLATLKRLKATTDVFIEYRFYLEVKAILERL